MDIHVDEVSRIDSPGDTPGYLRVYVRVTATEGAKSVTEEFHVGRQVVGLAVVTNAQGWMLSTDGNYYDPASLPDPEPEWRRERVVQDLKAEVLAVLRQTIRRRLDTNWTGDRVRMRDRLSLGNKATLPLAVRQLEGQVIN